MIILSSRDIDYENNKELFDKIAQTSFDDLVQLCFGIRDEQILTLNPSDIRIQYKDDLLNPQYKYEQGGMDWIRSVSFEEPIDVDIKQDGKFYINDGHHRWFAAKKLGLPIKAKVHIALNLANYIKNHPEIQEKLWKIGKSD